MWCCRAPEKKSSGMVKAEVSRGTGSLNLKLTSSKVQTRYYDYQLDDVQLYTL